MKKTLLLTSLLCMLLLASAAQARYRDGDDLTRIRIEGYVESIRGQVAYVRDDCGTTFRVHLGPAWYWEDHDYRLYSGSYVEIVAWMDYDEDYCYAGEIRGRNFCFDLCDSYGFPRWSDRDYCDATWRPSRSFFSIHFVIGGHFWHCYRPTYVHYRPWYDGCTSFHYSHRTWHSREHERDHRRDHGRWDDDHGRGGNDDRRGGRRDTGGGGGNNYGSDDSRYEPRVGVIGNGNSSEIVKPRSEVTKPEKRRNDDSGSKVRIEKSRTTEKSRASSNSRSKSSSKSSTKSSRGSSSKSDKSYARK